VTDERRQETGARSQERTGAVKRPTLVRKRVVTKEDGRYLIFYEFDNSEQQEGRPQ
jgi:hypothetical protein